MTSRALLDRDLDAAWMDYALALPDISNVVAARSALNEMLLHTHLGETARQKTVTAIARTWVSPDGDARPLLDSARASHRDRHPDPVVHLGLLLASQRFFLDLLDVTGRSMLGQEDVSTIDLRRRMKQIWGTRRSVEIAVQRSVKTMRSIGILHGQPSRSISTRGSLTVHDPEIAMWLLACLLVGRGVTSIDEHDARHAAELFAVHLPKSLPARSPWVTRHTEGGGRHVFVLDLPR